MKFRLRIYNLLYAYMPCNVEGRTESLSFSLSSLMDAVNVWCVGKSVRELLDAREFEKFTISIEFLIQCRSYESQMRNLNWSIQVVFHRRFSRKIKGARGIRSIILLGTNETSGRRKLRSGDFAY